MQLIGGRAFIGDALSISPHGQSVTIVDEDNMQVTVDLLTLVRAVDVARVDCEIHGRSFEQMVCHLQEQANRRREMLCGK